MLESGERVFLLHPRENLRCYVCAVIVSIAAGAREYEALSSFGFVTVPQSSPDSQHASTGKRMSSAVTETSVEPGQVEQEPAGLSSTSSMVLPPDCGKA